MSIPVNIENFARAESDRMFASFVGDAGGVNRVHHQRAPAAVDHQLVIRLNRDTLYSFAVADISEGAVLTLPDAGARYLSAMVVNQDHYVNRVFHSPGRHELTMEELDTPWVTVAVRILLDPNDADDLATVAALQDEVAVEASSAKAFELPDYDKESFDATRNALLALARGMDTFEHTFGTRSDVDPVRHLLGAAAGWGGLPDTEAMYIGVEPKVPVGDYKLTVRDVPVDGFWSISVYNAEGYFEPNDRNAYSVNNITAARDDDGSVTVHFGGCDDDRPNCLPITEGWNYTVRLYRPRPEARDGSWAFPAVEPA